jgi:aspartyl/asparaginyl-tRNA synthetase
MTHVDPREFNAAIIELREFFLSRGFIEVYVQNRLSILAACEDPTTISTFQYRRLDNVYGLKDNVQDWPLPQTSQMWLEHLLLSDPTLPGIFCLSTSYRNEPNPVPGRHDLIFPMFEFESRGSFEDLLKLERDLLRYAGFTGEYHEFTYSDMADYYATKELTHMHETKMAEDFGNVVFLKQFPSENAFFNMKKNPDGKTSQKVDVIINGIETIGSAERSTDPVEMEREFRTISDGQYMKKLYDLFGEERVEKELQAFLKHDFVPRFGGGIGGTRWIRAKKSLN